MKTIFFLFRKRSNKLTLSAAIERVYGIGKYNSIKIARVHGLQHNIKLFQIKINLLKKMQEYIERNFVIGLRLKRKSENIVSAIAAQNTHRGRCHRNELPAHFQRTHSNAKTAKFKFKKKQKK